MAERVRADPDHDRAPAPPEPAAPGGRWGPALLAALSVAALVAFDPVGWDSFGPIRWLLVPALGFAAISTLSGRIDRSVLGRGHTDRLRALSARLWVALLAWGLVAAAFGVDRLHAFIGTPDRRFGWSSWLLCGGLALVAATATDRERRVVTAAIAVGAAGLGLYTAAEWAGLAIDVTFPDGRLGGPFGQPAYLGAAATLALPVAAGLAADRAATTRWRVVGAAGAAGGLLALLGSQARAAWLGALVAGLVLLVARAAGRSGRLGSEPHAGHRVLAASAAAIVVPLAVVLTVPALRARITSSLDQGGVVAGRIDEWRVGLRAAADAPLLGYGPEGYRTVFGRHVDEQYVIDWGRTVITDRAHGGWLDVGLSFGAPGVLLYLALLAIAVLAAVRAVADGRPAMAGLGLAVIAYAVQQQFLFPLVELDPVFWIVAGLVVAGSAPSPSTVSVATTGRAVVGGLLIGLTLVATAAGVLDLAANQRLAAAVDATEADRAQSAIDDARTLRPDSIRYDFVAARLARTEGDLDRAIALTEDGLDRSRADPALLGERAGLLLDRARGTPPGDLRDQRFAEAEAALRSLLAVDPLHPEHLQRLAIALALQGEFDEAIELLDRAITLAPDAPEPAANRAEVLRLRDADR